MNKYFVLISFLILKNFGAFAQTVNVLNLAEFDKAIMSATAGTVIDLSKGNWRDVYLQIKANGTKEKPITIIGANISGKSGLAISGTHLIISDFVFNNGEPVKDNVVSFRTKKGVYAYDCVLKNCTIENFNSKRTDENNWVGLYGQRNVISNCSFVNKTNLGVLMAVHLDDDSCRNNSHLINKNYFGKRMPLGSNGGEIIRVGVSQHCTFDSKTQINENYFFECDGEAEIISIKSCRNTVSNNYFINSQGAVVLRHGDYNLVSGNYFNGGNKPGTGGVRIINKGQIVINNLFENLTGSSFRSPLTLMNGVPNSPANRYVQVQDAIIAYNTFINCTPFVIGEGNDAERSLAPVNVQMFNNLVVFNGKAALIEFKDTNAKIDYGNNFLLASTVSNANKYFENLTKTVSERALLRKQNYFIAKKEFTIKKDSLVSILSQYVNKQDLSTLGRFSKITEQQKLTFQSRIGNKNHVSPKVVKLIKYKACKTSEELINALKSGYDYNISLSAGKYQINESVFVNFDVSISGKGAVEITCNTAKTFVLKNNGRIYFQNVSFVGKNSDCIFVSTDSVEQSTSHAVLVSDSKFKNFSTVFEFQKNTFTNFLTVTKSSFEKIKDYIIKANDELDKKGYYNIEEIKFERCTVTESTAQLASIMRTGTDESTFGPIFNVDFDRYKNIQTKKMSFIELHGVQQTNISKIVATSVNTNSVFIEHKDWRSATHIFEGDLSACGTVIKNEYTNIKSK